MGAMTGHHSQYWLLNENTDKRVLAQWSEVSCTTQLTCTPVTDHSGQEPGAKVTRRVDGVACERSGSGMN